MQPQAFKPVLLAAGIAAIVGIATWAVARTPSARSPGAASRPVDERIDQLLAMQEAQGRRLDTLETILMERMGRTRSAMPAGMHGHGGEGDEAPVSPEEARRKMQSLAEQADAVFLKEPVSAAWAAATEKLVDDSFAAKNLEWLQAPTPLAHSSECRTFSCRISVTYRDNQQADIGQQFFLADIASKLPKARLFRLPNADGTVQVVAYANTGRARH